MEGHLSQKLLQLIKGLCDNCLRNTNKWSHWLNSLYTHSNSRLKSTKQVSLPFTKIIIHGDVGNDEGTTEIMWNYIYFIYLWFNIYEDTLFFLYKWTNDFLSFEIIKNENIIVK